MRCQHVAVVGSIAVATSVAAPAANAVAAPAGRIQTLFFDAALIHTTTTTPATSQLAQRQTTSGTLRNATGRRTGRFSFVCSRIGMRPDGALESCHASAWTLDGRLDAAGLTNSNRTTHHWTATGGTGAYRHANGRVVVRDLSERESLVTAELTIRRGDAFRAGALDRPAANRGFIARADRRCRRAQQRLSALPPFPFGNFDPLHPDGSLLPSVGAFFTGAGDPRPILTRLDADLRGLGRAPADHQAWVATLRARRTRLSIIAEQGRAGRAGDVNGFLRSVHKSAANFRKIAISATVFGATRCVL